MPALYSKWFMATLGTAVLSVVLGVSAVHGQSAGAFAQMGFGARGMGMGNALVADAFGDASPYYNPALAPSATGQNVLASAALMTFDRELQFLQFASPLEPSAGVAVGLTRGAVSDIDGRDASGYHTGTLSTEEFASFLAFGVNVAPRLTLGAAFKVFRSTLDDNLETADGFGLSVGALVRVHDDLFVGLAADDLIASYEWDTSGFFETGGRTTVNNFPTRLRLGAAHRLLNGRLHLVAEAEMRLLQQEVRQATAGRASVRTTDTRYRLGGEWRFDEVLSVRLGTDRLGVDGLRSATPTAGFALQQALGELTLRMTYAFLLEPYDVGTMHVLSLRMYI
ncbi:MAG: hypothetical protein GVY15_09900 [Bacteroidetes bacterium]|jgi:hypothetical protein|nr:hypothetical protein [Bacteroidota bacterium]